MNGTDHQVVVDVWTTLLDAPRERLGIAQQALYTALADQVTAQEALETARAAFFHAIGSPVAEAR